MNYTKEVKADGVWLQYETQNVKGETLVVNIQKVSHDLTYKKSLMNLWVKNGWLPKALESFWSIDTYVTDTEGNCYSRYNPQTIWYQQFDSKGKVIQNRNIINFEWILEATLENYEKIVAEVERRFMEMIPTEKKTEVTA